MRARAGIFAVILAYAAPGFPSIDRVHAQDPGCFYAQDDQGSVYQVCPGGAEGDPGGGGVASIQYSPYRWIRLEFQSLDCRQWPDPPPAPPAPPFVQGTRYVVWLFDTRTGLYVGGPRVECIFPPDRPPLPPPAPPSPAQVLDDMAPILGVTPIWWPRVAGLTGLETKFWCESPPTVTTSANLNGWQYTATSGLVGLSWSVSGPESLSVPGGSGCGDEADPSGRWVPNLLGQYEVTGHATWGGSYTATYEDEYFSITTDPVSMGTVTVSGEPVPYTVNEHVGVLVD